MASPSTQNRVAVVTTGHLDLQKSELQDLQLAGVYTRSKTEISLACGYTSDQDDSDDDEEDGRLYNEKEYHDNGQQRFFRTYQKLPAKGSLPACERMVEEKHFDVGGVCRMDVHFGLGQPYLSRKHYFQNQRLKSEKLFFVEDERTMKSKKAGHWREYYDWGSVMSELVYDANGMRCGVAKRYAEDGTVEWLKDYTKDYMGRVEVFNNKRGQFACNVQEAALLLEFPPGKLPADRKELDHHYRKKCAPLHPDKSPDPDSHEKFLEVSRAREILIEHLSNSSI